MQTDKQIDRHIHTHTNRQIAIYIYKEIERTVYTASQRLLLFNIQNVRKRLRVHLHFLLYGYTPIVNAIAVAAAAAAASAAASATFNVSLSLIPFFSLLHFFFFISFVLFRFLLLNKYFVLRCCEFFFILISIVAISSHFSRT